MKNEYPPYYILTYFKKIYTWLHHSTSWVMLYILIITTPFENPMPADTWSNVFNFVLIYIYMRFSAWKLKKFNAYKTNDIGICLSIVIN